MLSSCLQSFITTMHQLKHFAGKYVLSLSLSRILIVFGYEGLNVVCRYEGEELEITLYIRIRGSQEELYVRLAFDETAVTRDNLRRTDQKATSSSDPAK